MSERIKVNPDSYSQLPPKFEDLEAIKPIGHNEYAPDDMEYKDKVTGETYYEISSNVSLQELVVGLLKGIIPVSDIVHVVDSNGKTHFLSKSVTLTDYESKMTISEITACILLLELLFHDTDHNLNGRNLKQENKKFAFYDFDLIKLDFFDTAVRRDIVRTRIVPVQDDVLIECKKRIRALQSKLSGEDGTLFITALFKKCTAQSNESGKIIFNDEEGHEVAFDAKSFSTHFAQRITESIDVISSELAKRNV